MQYEKVWKVLEDLFKTLVEQGEKVPSNIINDLRAAKTLIQIYKMKPDDSQSIVKIETLLDKIESGLIFLMEKSRGVESAKEWMRKIEDVRMGRLEVIEEEAITRAVYGVPKDKSWIKIKLSADLTRERIEEEAKGLNLKVEESGEGHVLVIGNKDDLKSLIKNIAETST